MIYRFKMTTGRKDGFFREYEIDKRNTLYDFHRFIRNDLDFDEAQISAFYTSDKDWIKHTQYSIFDMGNGAMDTIVIEDIINEKIINLIYTFDFYNNRSFLIEFLEKINAEPRKHYPRTADGKGNPPDQLIDQPTTEELPTDDLVLKKSKKDRALKEEEEEEYYEDSDGDNNDDTEMYDDDELNMLSETKDI